MPRATIWFFWLLASCVLLSTPAAADQTVRLIIATKPAPALVFTDDKGDAHTLNPKTHKLSLVHFWATWCAPCVAELPQVDAVAKAYADKGLQVIAISLDGDQDMNKVKQFYASHKIMSLAPYLDTGNASFRAAGLQGLPDTLFIDAGGREIARAEGPLDWKSKEVTAFIEGHLK